MARKKRYTATEVAEAIKEARGYVSKAATILGCTVVTVYNYINEYSSVAEAVNETREQRHDHVESALMKAIDEGNVTAAIFYLKTQGRQRGWGEGLAALSVPVKAINCEVVTVERPSPLFIWRELPRRLFLSHAA